MKMKFSSAYLLALALSVLRAPGGGLVPGAAAEEIPEAPSTLHEAMDGICLERFARACVINHHFCVGAVARFDVGRDASEAVAWRCYSQEELDFSLKKRSCVDNCGQLIECKGAIKDTSMEHLTATDELEQMLRQTQEGMCKLHEKAAAI